MMGFEEWWGEYGFALGIGRQNARKVYDSAIQSWLRYGCPDKELSALGSGACGPQTATADDPKGK